MSINCIICSDLILPSGDTYVTQCGHIFHYPCLIQWIERSKSCPQCRARATEKTIHRVFLNFSNNECGDDVGTLHSKIDALQLEISMKSNDVKNLNEKYTKNKNKNLLLRQEVAKLESEAGAHSSIVLGLKDQVRFLKGKARDRDQLLEQVASLQSKLKVAGSIETVINGSRDEAEELLKNDNDPASLALLAAILKKTLYETEKTKHQAEKKSRQLQNDVTRYRRENNSLAAEISELKRELDVVRHNAGKEKKILQKILTKQNSESQEESATGSSGTANIINNTTRVLFESPLPQRFLSLSGDDSVINLSSGDEKTGASPYLPVKRDGGLMHFVDNRSKTSSSTIFRGAVGSLQGFKNKNDLVYDGLGGQSKHHQFPVPRAKESPVALRSLKRVKSLTSLGSAGGSSKLKVRKLAPISKK